MKNGFIIFILIITFLIANISISKSIIQKRDDYIVSYTKKRVISDFIYFLVNAMNENSDYADPKEQKKEYVFKIKDKICVKLKPRATVMFEVRTFKNEICDALYVENSPIWLIINQDYLGFKHKDNLSYLKNSMELMFQIAELELLFK